MVIPRETKKRLSTLYAKTYRQMLPSYFENDYRRDSVHKATKRRIADLFCRYDSSDTALCKLRHEQRSPPRAAMRSERSYWRVFDITRNGMLHRQAQCICEFAWSCYLLTRGKT
jgi:hypothetical protein